MEPRIRIGIDVGGTFTDLFLFDETSGETIRHKLPSTPGEPHIAPIQGVKHLLEKAHATGDDVAFIGLGTTVATNALLERKGAVTGLITTAGFRDLLQIARQKRPDVYDLHVNKPIPLASRRMRVEVEERIAADGTVLKPLNREGVASAVKELRAAKAQSVAICFLNCYANPQHEREAAAIVRAIWPEARVSVSHEILPEFREYERLSSTVINAFLAPVAHDYFKHFEEQVRGLGIMQPAMVMNSGGGVMTPKAAGERPIDTLFSGPSGGVSGAIYESQLAGYANIITFDMGGTSTDICVVQGGKPEITYSRVINGLPLKAPALDVHTVGAGGSSVASIDAGGFLQVGPQSAGAKPGPACYGIGGEQATVTDANVVLGRLNQEFLLAGALKIDASRSHTAIAHCIARQKGSSVVEAAAAIVALANVNMAQAVRFVTVERGLDPRDFVLVAFGGAGPLHAAEVAQDLGVASVLVPRSPGVLCAMGVLTKDVRIDVSQTNIMNDSRADFVERAHAVFTDLEQRARTALSRQGFNLERIVVEHSVDARYAGQNHELSVEVTAVDFNAAAANKVRQRFNDAHRRLYGYAVSDRALELVTFRLKAIVRVDKPDLAPLAPQKRDTNLVPIAWRRVFYQSTQHMVECPVYDRTHLAIDDLLSGPAIIEQMDTTTVVPPGCTARVDQYLNLILRWN